MSKVGAYTALTSPYPEYINITVVDERATVTIRERPTKSGCEGALVFPGNHACIELPVAELKKIIGDLEL